MSSEERGHGLRPRGGDVRASERCPKAEAPSIGLLESEVTNRRVALLVSGVFGPRAEPNQRSAQLLGPAH
eukprot:4149225-Alexandrium_andersonii.AAC.1